MRVGIPNLLPLLGYFLSTGVLYFLWVTALSPMTGQGNRVGMLLILIPAIVLFFIINWQLQVIIIFKSHIFCVAPFRLNYKYLSLKNPFNIEWQLVDSNKFGNYKKLSVRNSHSNTNIDFSDYEFINFNQLESFLTSNKMANWDTARKRTVEIGVAKVNKWINLSLIAIFLFLLFVILFLYSLSDTYTIEPIGLLGITFITIVIFRLGLRLQEYDKWLKRYENIRRRRLKNLRLRIYQ